MLSVRAWLAIAGLGLLAGCSIGPKYVRPAIPVPALYPGQTGGDSALWKPSKPADGASRGNWWEIYHDGQLNELEAKLNGSNQNIAAAAAAVLGARARIRESRAQLFPTVTGGSSITNSRLSTFGPKPAGVVYTEYSLPAQASWEPDLWGRVRHTIQASALAAQASSADLENVRLAAQADLAIDYFELRSQDEMKYLLDATVKAYTEALDLTRDRCDAGLESDEAVAQAETQLEAAQAQDTGLGTLRAEYEDAIAMLVGEAAPGFHVAADTLRVVESLNVKHLAIPPGLPSQLLERRPDIASAERSVAQANTQIGIAMAAFYPNVTLSATGGLENIGIAQWLTWPSRVWSVGPGISETLFDAGLRKSTVSQYRAAYDQTVANYRQTVLTAFQQVEDQLVSMQVLQTTIEQQDAAVRSAERTLSEATTRYEAGLDPYLNVITAQTALLTNRQTDLNFHTQQVLASVQLIKALGGDWDVSKLPSVKDLTAEVKSRK